MVRPYALLLAAAALLLLLAPAAGAGKPKPQKVDRVKPGFSYKEHDPVHIVVNKVGKRMTDCGDGSV
jgi:hypothetical protein